MDCGFDTIGNATLICYDRKPMIVTDPWIRGDAYFGSWRLSHTIPEEQMAAALACPFVWFSHGHPDHLNPESLPLFRSKKILLPDHVGGRIFRDLKKEGYDVQILPDRTWFPISDRIRVCCIADYWQDAVLLVEINGSLIANINDTSHGAWCGFVRRAIRRYPTSFLLSLCCFGDVDMINFFGEDGRRITPSAARRDPLGVKIAAATESFGAKFFVPFSSMHRYQRKDSIWVDEYRTIPADFSQGFQSEKCLLLPAFLRYDCIAHTYLSINPPPTPEKIVDPAACGDDWSDGLEKDDIAAAEKYFGAVEPLRETLDFINLRVGGKDNFIRLSREKRDRGITFEAPRASLMTAIRYEVFDDMLIGNFMKTHLHGAWQGTDLYPYFVPWVTKFADNGRAKTKAQIREYERAYAKRSLEVPFYLLEKKSKEVIQSYISRESAVYRTGKRLYQEFKKVVG